MSSKVFRIILPILLLGFVVWYSDPHKLWETFTEIDILQLILLFFVSFGMIYVSCIKWRMFLQASGTDAPISELFKLYVLGYFINLFSPSTLGGDAVRSYQLGKKLGSQVNSFSATFLERFTGLLAMALLAMIFLLLGSEQVKGFEIPVVIVFLSTSVIAIAAFSNFGYAIFDKFARFGIRLLGQGKLANLAASFLKKIETGLSSVRGNLPLFLKSFLVSLVFHGFTIINTKIAANALGWWTAPVGGLFVVVPLVLIASAVPITPSGLGIQEGAFLFFLEKLGAGRAEAAGVALLLRAKAVVLGILGGIIFLSLQKEREK